MWLQVKRVVPAFGCLNPPQLLPLFVSQLEPLDQLADGPLGDGLLMAAVTGEPGLETSAHAKEAGFDVHFGKPMEGRDIEMLLSRLNDVPADVKTDADSDPRRERLSAH